ncbi:hypothetical protein A0128_06585 [Leptospira tipperaryensis]|uniref:Uncharacterized protein n=1 Tax=Leptospira tipperaryensis TaxID=2564040 RepID=A0A1D7UVH5_9LEPT|nr:hypothetical protein A0128_06585 [Leptospira tipperaryensis]
MNSQIPFVRESIKSISMIRREESILSDCFVILCKFARLESALNPWKRNPRGYANGELQMNLRAYAKFV